MDITKNTWVNGAVYAAATAGTIVGQWKDLHALEYACKPLMMLVLSSWFYFNSRRVGDRFTLMVQAGLFFSLVGDVALMFQHRDEFNFLIGLAAFMVAHLCYVIAFGINVFEMGGAAGAIVSSALAAMILVFGVFFTLDLLGNANVDQVLKVPVGAYAVTITVMGIIAAFRFRRTYVRSFWMVFAGALLFILSDALLADRKFNMRPIEVDEVWVLLSYALAQFLIAAGCLLHVLDPEMMRRRQALSA